MNSRRRMSGMGTPAGFSALSACHSEAGKSFGKPELS
jgi:hypothetical protein